MEAFTINCDMGESYGRYKLVDDAALMPYIDECNIACGFHAGDPLVIERTILAALKYDLKIGAHPSFPDLQGFGRRPMTISPEELECLVRYQIATMDGLVRSHGGTLHHVKSHGALYNQAVVNMDTANAVAKAVMSINPDLVLFAPFQSVQARIAKEMGLNVSCEAFIDRRYHKDLTLVNRRQESAVIQDKSQALEQVISITERKVVNSVEGKEVRIESSTLCIHGDNPSALEILNYLCLQLNRPVKELR